MRAILLFFTLFHDSSSRLLFFCHFFFQGCLSKPWQQSPERARLEEVNVELAEVVSVKLEESKVQSHPGTSLDVSGTGKDEEPLFFLCV